MSDPYEPYAQVLNSITLQDVPFPYKLDDDPIYKRYYAPKYGYIPEAERKKQYMRTDYYREMRIAADRDFRMYRQAGPTLEQSLDQYQETVYWENSKLRQAFPDAKPLSQAERRRKASPAFKKWSGYDGFKTDGIAPSDQLADYDATIDKPAPQMLPPVRRSYAMDPVTGQLKDQFTYDGNLFRAWYNQKIEKGEKVDYASLLKQWKDQSTTGDPEFEKEWEGDQKEYLLYEKEKKVPPQGFQSKDEAYNSFVGRKNRENPNYDAAAKDFGPGWDDLSPLQQSEMISAYKPPAPKPDPAPKPAPKPDPKPAPKPDPKPPAPKPDPKPPAPKPDPKPPAPKPDPKPPAPKPKPKPDPTPSPGPASASTRRSAFRIVAFL